MADKNEHSTPALTPEIVAQMNAMIAAAVGEAVKQLVPVMTASSVKPGDLVAAMREANRPFVDPLHVEREKRETLQSKENEAENRRLDAERRANCPHKDKRGQSSINLVHNHLDHQPRGICVICGDWIFPKEWRIAATEAEAAKHETHKGKAYIVPAHKDYKTVMALEAMS